MYALVLAHQNLVFAKLFLSRATDNALTLFQYDQHFQINIYIHRRPVSKVLRKKSLYLSYKKVFLSFQHENRSNAHQEESKDTTQANQQVSTQTMYRQTVLFHQIKEFRMIDPRYLRRVIYANRSLRLDGQLLFQKSQV